MAHPSASFSAADDLRDSLYAAIDVLASRVAVLDERGRVHVVNRAWRQSPHRSRFDLQRLTVGEDFLSVCDAVTGPAADDARAVASAVRDVLAGSNTDQIVQICDPDPVDERWFVVRISGSHDGAAHRAVLVIDDISDRRKAEQARRLVASGELETQVDARTRDLQASNKRLRDAEATLSDSETRFRAAANATADLIVEASLREDRLQWFGDVDTLMGYDPGGFPRSPTGLLALVHPDDVGSVGESWAACHQVGARFRASYRIRAKDGAYHDWESFGQVIAYEKERVTRFVGAIRDVTELKALELAQAAADAELQNSQTELRALTARLFSAEEDGRRRLARELHDSFNQQMAAISIQIGAIRQRTGAVPQHIRQELARVQDQVVELSNDLRRVSHELHPAALEQLGLVTALKAYCKRVSQAEAVEVRFRSTGVPPGAPRDVGLCVFRLVQEALRNAVRHSGASVVKISVERLDDDLELRVVDDGHGFDAAAVRQKGSLGLVSMAERVRPLRGTLTVRSSAGEGTEVVARVPVDVHHDGAA